MDWNNPDTWRVLVSDTIAMSESLLVFGVQYIASAMEPGMMKAINSLRCMLNNAGTNVWQFAAGIW